MLGNLAIRATSADSSIEKNSAWGRLRELIETHSLIVVESGEEFTLSSGRKSRVFFNLKQTMLLPEGSNLLAEAILKILKEHDVHNVGGLEMGAVPLVCALSQKSFGQYNLNAFFVRKKAKEHGAREQVDGHLAKGEEAIILDDVVTTGGSVLKAVRAARERGCAVKTVVAIVDREEGAREALKAEGLELIALYRRSDFTDAL